MHFLKKKVALTTLVCFKYLNVGLYTTVLACIVSPNSNIEFLTISKRFFSYNLLYKNIQIFNLDSILVNKLWFFYLFCIKNYKISN